jgi:hypothetical protein
MPIEPGDRERARALGKRSGEARRRLSLDEIRQELPPLDSPQSIRANLELAQRWAIAGLLPPGTAQAVMKACGEATRLMELSVDLALIKKLERRVAELEQELVAARSAAAGRGR